MEINLAEVKDKALTRLAKRLFKVDEIQAQEKKDQAALFFNKELKFDSGMILTSNTEKEYLESKLFEIDFLNSSISLLDETITNNRDEIQHRSLSGINEVKQIESNLQEEELKVNENYNYVFYNAFVRPKDYPLLNKSFADYKTSVSYTSKDLLHMRYGAGLSLPIENRSIIDINDIFIDVENTDVGDYGKPLHNTSINSLKEHKRFNWIVGLEEITQQGLRRKHSNGCRLVLNVYFQRPQMVNFFSLTSGSIQKYTIESLSYVNEANELVNLNLNAEIHGTENWFLEPFLSKHIIISLKQKIPISVEVIKENSLYEDSKQKILEGMLYEETENTNSKVMKIYDLSIEDISFEYVLFKETGYFCSQPLNVESLSSVSLSLNETAIQLSSTLESYGLKYILPDKTVFSESYLIVEGNDNKNKYSFTFPVPKKGREIVEKVLPSSGIGIVSFAPDYYYLNNKFLIEEANYNGSYVTLTINHSFSIGQTFYTPMEVYYEENNEDLNFLTEEWSIVSDNQIVCLRKDASSFTGSVTENATPKGLFLSSTKENFELYEEDSLLELGLDYQISFDMGKTWLSEIPKYNDFVQYKFNSFKIKLKSFNPNQLYWTKYWRRNNLYLDDKKYFKLVNDYIILSKDIDFKNTNLYVQLILRADSIAPNISPVINNYFLKVRTK